MFGYAVADVEELTPEQKKRYESIYCGICRRIGKNSGQLCRLGLQYDMAFLAMLLMSLYEPEEICGDRACVLHPVKPKSWVDSEIVGYCADMNVALAYYKALDDRQDDGRRKLAVEVFSRKAKEVARRYPRQCGVMETSIRELSCLEQAGCENPDEPASCFGRLLGELFVYREDRWQTALRQTGEALGRYIYLADAAEDYREDEKRGRYNPFLAMGGGEDPVLWKKYLVLTMGRCTDGYERLPLVQDKEILDNVLYSGVWMRRKKK